MPNRKVKPLVISNFKGGIADSPYVGIGNMQNCDIDSTPGAVRVNLLPEEISTAVIGNLLIHWTVRDPATGNHYALSSSGKVYKRTHVGGLWTDVSHANNTTAAAGNGLVIWKDYLLVLKNTQIDALKLSDDTWTTTGWSPDGLALTTDAWHPALVGQDDTLYIGTGRYIYTIKETAGQNFVPGTDGTVTTTQKALDLPEGYRIRALQELGKNLMIGTWVETATKPLIEVADIFPWDRLSQSFNIPIQVKELGIRSMLSHNNILYFIAGLRGQLYATDGARVTKLRRLPKNIFGTSGGKFVDVYPDAMDWHQNKLMIGTSVNNTVADDGYGIWSYDEGKLQFEHKTSEGNSGANSIYIGSVNAFSEDTLIFSWLNTTGTDDAGIDTVNVAKRYGSYGAFIESKFYDVAFKHEKRTFRSLEVRLGRDLNTGEGIRIKYRDDLDDSFTTLATFTDAAHTHRSEIFLTLQSIQLRIELTTDGAGANSNGSPELLAVVLR